MDLDKRDLTILIARRNGLSYAKIGNAHGITRSRVQQICDKAARRTEYEAAAELSTRIIAELNSWLQRHGQDAIT